MTYKPLENLKGHASNKPPMVVFMVCLFLFAVAMVSLGIYIKDTDIQDFDLTEDWNSFLDDFSTQKFCLALNDTLPTHTEMPTLDNDTVTITVDTVEESIVVVEEEAVLENRNNHTMAMHLIIDASVYLSKMPPNITLLASVMPASAFGIDSSEQVHALFELPQPFKPVKCSNSDVECHSLTMQTCLTLVASEAIFPTTKTPSACNISDTHREYTSAWISAKTPSSDKNWCSQGLTVHAQHMFDPRLTVMLSAAERSIINLHLMYTSYFLFVMVITWVCYALLKGPPGKQRVLHIINPSEKKGTAPI